METPGDYKSMLKSNCTETVVEDFQTARARALIPQLEAIEKSSYMYFQIIYYFTWIIGILSTGVGATLLSELGDTKFTSQLSGIWGSLATGFAGTIVILHGLIKAFGLEDMKNRFKLKIQLCTDLRTILEECILHMQTMATKGLDPNDQKIWDKVVAFAGTVDKLILSMNLGDDLRDKLEPLKTSALQLQHQGIIDVHLTQVV